MGVEANTTRWHAHTVSVEGATSNRSIDLDIQSARFARLTDAGHFQR